MQMTLISHFGRILGSLFYNAPTSEQNLPLLSFLKSGDWQADCDFLSTETTQKIQAYFSEFDLAELDEEYQRLFIGPHALAVAPWGSVYLDKEEVIFGDSLLAMRAFLKENGIAFVLDSNEPEDHFGLMLMLSAYLAEQHPDKLASFLGEHFLTWGYRFLTLLQAQPSSFYVGLAQLTEQFLLHWQQQLSVVVKEVQLYR
ncbi:TPA: Tat proofreading chaperone DmsD [Pasteurella multocida]|nr:Tat proofreading chaperone DmsD [Pasteurella multocida]